MPQPWAIFVFLLVAAAVAFAASADEPRPNIVYIMTDDQDAQLGSMDYMPLTRRLVGEAGITFDHYYVTTSLCCPSRTSLLTGQFCHNHGLWENEEIRNGGMARFIELGLERANLATWLKEGGYTTALFGKFLNGYHTSNVSFIPPGWDRWFVATQETISHYDKTCYSDQGRNFCPKVYQTDAIRDKAVEFINALPSSSSSLSSEGGKPFFLQITPHAPHRPCLPAARHRHLFLGAKAPRTPSFNASQRWQDTKVSWIRDVEPLTQAQVGEIDQNWVLRLQSLQAVDELVQAVVEALERRGLLNNTYVFYTSDNGWHLGQHRLQWGKRQAYEEDIRVPMLVRGPGVPRGVRRTDLVANIDVTPTLLDIAQVNVSRLISHVGQPVQLDGLSFLSTLSSADQPASANEGSNSSSGSLRQALLVEGNYTESGIYAGKYDLYTGLRVIDGTHDLLYVDWTRLGKQELYDLTTDPYELQNIVASYPDPAFKRKLACILNKLSFCRGSECHVPFTSMCP